ncbi:hypothetical protein M9Y10_025495 [Tritrichomonas musculus]|uniref:Protein kinase domain-containing protein n=1 Tax=Tritrichomonas musculus TaxID=1915356 RepID=A0ABR2H8Y3_9EUKA
MMERGKDYPFKHHNTYKMNIDDLEIVRPIDDGGFGVVFSVKDKNTSKEYAAKVIPYKGEESQYRQMINREIGILMRVQHPTIIKFYGYSLHDFNNNKNVTIIMQLAANGSLSAAIKKVRQGLADLMYDNTVRQIILVGIARGMMHLHEHHVIHRDLKPDNILLDERFYPLITDFGLSKFTETDNSINQSKACGTSIYKAPEVINSNKYNGKADVYSFGILMYEVVTDLIPYPLFSKGKLNLFQLNQKIIQENYRPEFTVPVKKSIRKLIERCWSGNPSERPTFEEIYHKLAFNIEDSIYDIYEGNEEEEDNDINNKYQLDDVDNNELLYYIDEINGIFNNHDEISSGDESSVKKMIHELSSNLEAIRKENEELRAHMSNIDKENQQLINKCKEIDIVKKENDTLKSKVEALEREAAPLKAENMQLSLRVANLERIIKGKGEITEAEPTKTAEIKEDEEEKVDLNISLLDFNKLSLKKQQLTVSELLSESLPEKVSQLLVKINNVLDYLLKCDSITEKDHYFEIQAINNEQKVTDIDEKEVKICLLFDSIKVLHNCKKLGEQEMVTLLNEFVSPSIELKYESLEPFKPIWNIIEGIKATNTNNKININLVLLNTSGISIFKDNFVINSVKIDPSIKVIPSSAFQGFFRLLNVSIPSSITRIDTNAFYYCYNLREVTIPPSVVSIGNCSFRNCEKLLEVKIPQSVTSIGDYAFFNCHSLVKVSIPSSLTNIGKQVFPEKAEIVRY